MVASLRTCCALFLALILSLPAAAAPRALTDDAWRQDIQEMMETLKSNHPALYKNVSEADLNDAAGTLISSLPSLSDKEIIVEMAKIVALVEDGHTRLSIPRQHDELAFSFSHSEPKRPKHKSLEFASLPFKFRVFGDDLYITHATGEWRRLLGAQVIAFDETPASEALERLSAVNYNDNFMTDKLLAGDRTSLPDVLKALGIVPSANSVALRVRPFGETSEATVTVLPLGEEDAVLSAPENASAPLWLQDKETVQWSRTLPREGAHYIQLNQIAPGFPDNLLADFMREEIKKATAARAEKIVIDLRHNHGGSGGFSRSVVNAIADSQYNQFGKFIVIFGRETFSAAQMLVNELEQYTDVLFFGEPTGANPDTYGDPKRIQLKNSGLDLRVSRLHWSTWRAFETRTATAPHFSPPYTIEDYMNGRDPVLEAALAYDAPQKLSGLLSDVFANGGNWDGGQIIFSRYLTDHRVRSRDFAQLASELLSEGAAREDNGEMLAALLLYVSVSRLNPEEAEAYLGWARTELALGDKDDAKSGLQAGLEVFPDNQEIRARLDALEQE